MRASPVNENALSALTIGHSSHTLERFMALLQQYRVTALADVRSMPYSRFSPQFNRTPLKEHLSENGIRYVFLGRELGARPEDPSCYIDGRVQYRKLAQTALFMSGIERVTKGAAKYRIALMCAERDPLDCHRTLLIGRALVDLFVQVDHVLSDGSLESHADAMSRLLNLTSIPDQDLFRSRAELISEALKKQEDRIAYLDPNRSP
jgi:uncharacterized protein (DUF488 family)